MKSSLANVRPQKLACPILKPADDFIYRVRFILYNNPEATETVRRHYSGWLDAPYYFECFNGICCESLKQPLQVSLIPAIIFTTSSNGEIAGTVNEETISVKAIKLSSSAIEKLINAVAQLKELYPDMDLETIDFKIAYEKKGKFGNQVKDIIVTKKSVLEDSALITKCRESATAMIKFLHDALIGNTDVAEVKKDVTAFAIAKEKAEEENETAEEEFGYLVP